MADHKQATRSFGCLDDLIAVGDGRGHGFFQQHMLPGSQSIDRDLAMVVDVRRNADHIDIGIGQQLVIVGIAFFDAQSVGDFGQSFGASSTQSRQFDIRHFSQVIGMYFAEPAQANDAPADAFRFIHGMSDLSLRREVIADKKTLRREWLILSGELARVNHGGCQFDDGLASAYGQGREWSVRRITHMISFNGKPQATASVHTEVACGLPLND